MKKNKTLFSIFILALILRLIPVLLSSELKIGLDDMFQYDMLARSIESGNGYRWYAQEDLEQIERYIDMDVVEGEYDPQGVLTSFRPPGYPTFLAIVYKLFGLENRFFAARIVQAFVGATLPVLTYILATQLFPEKKKIAKIAGLIIACYPMFVVYPIALATENTFMPLALASVVMLFQASKTHKIRDYIFAGILIGLTTLTRSVIFAFLPIALLWLWFVIKDKKQAWILLATVLILTVPWGVRNTKLHDRFFFIESALGYDMYMGYHPESLGTFQYGISLDLMPYLDDALRDEEGMQKTIEYIKEDPGRIPNLMVRKLGYFFGLEHRAIAYFYTNNFIGPIPQALLISIFLIITMPFVIVTSMAAFGFSFSKFNKEKWLIFLFVLAYITPHVLILAEARFHLTLLPVFSIWAAYAWVNRKEIISQTTSKYIQWKSALAFLILILLFLNWGLAIWRDSDKIALLFGPDGNKAGFDY
ncbi:MAG: glycosyltransferase family 39 protein [Chloroflexi bacterium]|jgi:hypothetical protein|nr:glycosyltransferase family 39 protein [Chloroflexota bacterium]MBT3669750.1 glycosyltransferase family 39 protein [Chloroflexota bacterium]MBT4002878.1 glycosyltransferase family 39 protein [Chloroflexota bacterium]MBT4305230.1 glycosyltransferase family 39 protein [Chloroflexota bacterium]MBT4534847.1 glycosyltransferase family 39 protein [Chloroflexota bacterium]